MIAMLPFKIKLAIVGILAVCTSFAVWLARHDAKVAKKVETTIVQRSEKEGAARAKQAAKAHDTAKRPGAAERLRADPKTCVDCR